ncbi:hypothetical protein C5167_032839 [Papaver somniferum]|uniref:Uncharacterized protein n=1 Tax=Papaver somniferum TaxID=3469 RepID=A0A4Y7K8M7_PAPSO|nr:hypothetical protein C5167_032839 [Papaver somniferum]
MGPGVVFDWLGQSLFKKPAKERELKQYHLEGVDVWSKMQSVHDHHQSVRGISGVCRNVRMSGPVCSISSSLLSLPLLWPWSKAGCQGFRQDFEATKEREPGLLPNRSCKMF